MYKLNQIEGAMNALASGKPSTALRRLGEPVPVVMKTRIKRLLEIDRERARAEGVSGEATVAFFDALPEGRGSDAQYDAFGAACLAIGLELLRFGFKQREIVGKIAAVRSLLERFYRTRIAQVSVEGTTYIIEDRDGQLPRKRSGRKQNQDVADPRGFLVLDAVEGADVATPSVGSHGEGSPRLCVGEEDLLRTLGRLLPAQRYGVFVIEVSELMLRTRELLDKHPVRRRGRG